MIAAVYDASFAASEPSMTKPVGREPVLRALEVLFASHEIVVLEGPLGIGKTTVARAFAETARFRGRTLVVGAADFPPEGSSSRLIVVEAAANDVAAVHARAQGLDAKVLIVTRAAKGIAAPILTLGPLETSRSVHAPSDAALLYLARARAVRRELPIDDKAIASVEELVSELGGVPLLIVAAAARARMLPAHALLGRRGRALVGGERWGSLRADLEATIADLDPLARRLLDAAAHSPLPLAADALRALAPEAPAEALSLALDDLATRGALVVTNPGTETPTYEVPRPLRDLVLEPLEPSSPSLPPQITGRRTSAVPSIGPSVANRFVLGVERPPHDRLPELLRIVDRALAEPTTADPIGLAAAMIAVDVLVVEEGIGADRASHHARLASTTTRCEGALEETASVYLSIALADAAARTDAPDEADLRARAEAALDRAGLAFPPQRRMSLRARLAGAALRREDLDAVDRLLADRSRDVDRLLADRSRDVDRLLADRSRDVDPDGASAVVLAEAALLRGEPSHAIAVASEAIALADARGLAELAARLRAIRGRAARALGDLSEARRDLDDAARRSRPSVGLEILAAEIAFAHDDLETAIFRSRLARAAAADDLPQLLDAKIIELSARALRGEAIALDLATAIREAHAAGLSRRATALRILEANEGATSTEPARVRAVGIGLAAEAVERLALHGPRAPRSTRIARDGSFFEASGRKVELGDRLALARLLAALVATQGTPIAATEVFGRVWPDEGDIDVVRAAARVRAAVATLRRLGLERALRRHAEGYFLEGVVVVDEPATSIESTSR
jgi:tetratricopeptide (TPR) repeat protein